MTLEKRAFNFVPDNHKTKQNEREYYVLDDVLFEPEQAAFVSGYIGTGDTLTELDKKRTPLIRETNPVRNKYQLSIGTAFVDPSTGQYTRGAFFDDLVNLIRANGGIVDDHNRLFSVPYYSYNIPIDYDKHINYSRYFWTGEGSADVNGEYVTKAPAGSQTVVHQKVNGAWARTLVRIRTSFPSSPKLGDMVERADTPERVIYRWNGTQWLNVNIVSEEGPDRSDIDKFLEGDYVYFTRTGPEFQRPLVHRFSKDAGRWIAQPVVTSKEPPDTPRKGMVWEDTSVAPYRRLKRFDGAQWVRLTWTPARGPKNIPADGTYIYDIRNVVDITDEWAKNNWWRHYEDLSSADREICSMEGNADQAVRPIVEFWGDLETVESDKKDFRNDQPRFPVYTYNFEENNIEKYSNAATTLFEFRKTVSGNPDPVLGFPVTYSDTGEFMFDLTLESDMIPGGGHPGYRFFKDAATGLVHSIWAKSDQLLTQDKDSNGLFEVSRALTDNPNHEVFTEVSRSKILKHMTSVIKSQRDFAGNELGLNSYRYTSNDPDCGSVIIDPESSLLRSMATVQDKALNIPDAIRQTQKEYNRVLFKFLNKLAQLFKNLTLCNALGKLTVTPAEAVDIILSNLFIGRNEDFAYHFADMGTYVETRKVGASVIVVDPAPKPIYIPSSPARIGAVQTYRPGSFHDIDGKLYIRGHDGQTIESFGDDRDLVWLELQNRFFNAVPAYRRTESLNFSTRFDSANFFLNDYVGGYTPVTTAPASDRVVNSYLDINAPAANLKVVSIAHNAYCVWTGDKWLTRALLIDDIFFNNEDEEYYIFNGFGVTKITATYGTGQFDYTYNDLRLVIHREYERWAAYGGGTMENVGFDKANRFTWNYRSAGVEGHYKGLYQRIYRTDMPHARPWEIVGYSIEPDWWRTVYPPSDTKPDGTPRYYASHTMWTALQEGRVLADNSRVVDAAKMIGPIPVREDGELMDPIEIGLIDRAKLDPTTLDDAFVFGDGSPAEQEFIRSSAYSFALTMAGFLMKPVRFVDTLWSVFHTYVGDRGSNRVWNAPHVVHAGLLRRTRLSDLPMHLEKLADGSTAVSVGLNAWIAETMRQNGADPTRDFARIVKNTMPCLGWRAAGFINKKRTIVETTAGKEIPYEDVHVVLHQAPVTNEFFCSGVVVMKEDTGYRVYGYDSLRPYFPVEFGVKPIIGGQVELREEITAVQGQRSFTVSKFTLPFGASDTARFSVMVDGRRIKDQHVKITSKTTFEIEGMIQIDTGSMVVAALMTAQSNASSRVKTFMVAGRQFSYNSMPSGEITAVEYGRYFETPDDVINFMIGYSRVLKRDGWEFDTIEPTTGEINDWVLGAKKFANWVVMRQDPAYAAAGYNPNLFYFSPMSTEVKFKKDFGQILNIESIQNGTYGIVGSDAQPLTPEESIISRVGDEMTIKPASPKPIYGIRLYTSEIQHAMFLSSITRFNDIIYHPVLSLWHETLRVETYRTANWNGRFEAPGFIINGDTLLPNFEKQAMDVTKFYDTHNPLDDVEIREQARTLYGYTPRPYLDAMDADDMTKYKYHRALFLTKGTRRPQLAFIRGTRLGTDNVFINEDWAWRVAEFGDTRADLVQFRVTPDDFTEARQVFMFSDTDIPGDHIVQVTGLKRIPNEVHPRWIIGPKKSTEGAANLEFPVTDAGIPDVSENRFFCQLMDKETASAPTPLFHWDPALGVHEPGAVAMIDVISFWDPAYYNDGINPAPEGTTVWGESQVGTLWWDQSRLRYSKYHGITDVLVKAREWGKQEYFRCTSVYADGVVTVTTLDALTKKPSPHGLKTGDLVTLTDAEQAFYNREELTVNVTGSNTFTYEVLDRPEVNIATGDMKCIVGAVTVYEWIASPVPPEEYVRFVNAQAKHVYDGIPYRVGEDYAYTTVQTRNEYGKTITNYYFWVRKNTKDIPSKSVNVRDVELRLDNPTTSGLFWFAPVSRDGMIVSTEGIQVNVGYALEILIDARVYTTHQEWVLISEDDQNNEPPAAIMNKLIDSMSYRDAQRNLVPSPYLSEAERIGNMTLPAQTVFPDVPAARKVFVNMVNELLRETEIGIDTNLYSIFPLIYEDRPDNNNYLKYWSRSDYRHADYKNVPLTDTVATYDERERRLSEGMYAPGDLVKVLYSDRKDAWYITQTVAATYVRTDKGWTVVGTDNWSPKIIDAWQPIHFGEFRAVWDGLKKLLTAANQNRLCFALLREMLRQNKNCDWFFKTSYMTVQIFSELTMDPYTRPSEVDAIIENINDTKPYRTKIRSQQATYAASRMEAFDTEIQEIPDKKITLLFDRLNCTASDGGGFDSFFWDFREFDLPIWAYDDLGRAKFDEIGRFKADTKATSFTLTPRFAPKLYPLKTVILDRNGSEINQEEVLVRVTYVMDEKYLTVNTSYALPDGYTIVVYQARGFVEGPVPTLGSSVLSVYPSLIAYESTYEHAGVRAMRYSDTDSTEYVPGCQGDAEKPEERISYGVVDSVMIAVTQSQTPLYGGFDCAPFDVVEFDSAPKDVGDRTFFITVGNRPEFPPNEIAYPVYEDAPVGDTEYVSRSRLDANLAYVMTNDGDVTWALLEEGVDWFRVTPSDDVIRLAPEHAVKGHAIRFIYTSWTLQAPLGYVEVRGASWEGRTDTDWPSVVLVDDFTMWLRDFDITKHTRVPNAGSVKVFYPVPRLGPHPIEHYVRAPIVVDDILDHHNNYDGVLGFETGRPNGQMVIDTTYRHLYRWDKEQSKWIDEGGAPFDTNIFVRRNGCIYNYNGQEFVLVHSPGEIGLGTWGVAFPPRGEGLTSGVYTFGSNVNAAIEWPTAFAIMEHPGDPGNGYLTD